MSQGTTEFRVFGPLTVIGPNGSLAAGGHLERAVLAVLLLTPQRAVAVERIASVAWSGRPSPQNSAHAVQTHVMRLRHHLGPELVATEPHGYRLAIAPEVVDVHRFDRLIHAANAAVECDDLEKAEASCRAALAEIGRGEPWIDLVDSSVGEGERARLHELRLAAEEQHAGLVLLLGRGSSGETERLAAEQPLREIRWILLMYAQVMAGRQADALRSYTRARTILQTQLGIDPSPRLRDLEQRVLGQDPRLHTPTVADLLGR